MCIIMLGGFIYATNLCVWRGGGEGGQGHNRRINCILTDLPALHKVQCLIERQWGALGFPIPKLNFTFQALLVIIMTFPPQPHQVLLLLVHVHVVGSKNHSVSVFSPRKKCGCGLGGVSDHIIV